MIIIKREDIRWGEMGATYLYGSQITYHADGQVTLKNPLLASLEASPASLFLRKIIPTVYL